MSTVAERLQRKTGRKPAEKQVRLKLVYVDFWSALKISFFIGVALGIVLVIVVALAWIVLNSTGIFVSLDSTLGGIFNNPDLSIARDFSFTKVLTFVVVVAAVDVVIITVLGAIAAGLYNAIVKMTGGFLVGFTNA